MWNRHHQSDELEHARFDFTEISLLRHGAQVNCRKRKEGRKDHSGREPLRPKLWIPIKTVVHVGSHVPLPSPIKRLVKWPPTSLTESAIRVLHLVRAHDCNDSTASGVMIPGYIGPWRPWSSHAFFFESRLAVIRRKNKRWVFTYLNHHFF